MKRTFRAYASEERMDRCVRTRRPVEVTTPAATIMAVRARSISEAEDIFGFRAIRMESRQAVSCAALGGVTGIAAFVVSPLLPCG